MFGVVGVTLFLFMVSGMLLQLLWFADLVSGWL